ncbi:MAG: carbon monoxide dehydrogenase subunit G [Alphaproteobacteria bacterium]
MNLSGEHIVPAPKKVVWDAVTDPTVLCKIIPGCQELSQTSEAEYEAVAQVKVGPLKARFKGTVRLTDIEAPDRCRIIGEGQGGAAGFASGSAYLQLEERDGVTIVRYDADASIGGKLAQIGSRIVSGVAEKLTLKFFENLSDHFEVAKEPA